MSTYPPDKIVVTAGVWNTDIELATDRTQSGNYAIKFKNTAVAARVRTDFIPMDEIVPLHFGMTVQSDAATQEIYCVVNVYESNKTTLIATLDATLLVLAAANTWYNVAKTLEAISTARFCTIEFGKYTAEANNVWVDKFFVNSAPYACSAYRATTNQSVAAGGVKIALNEEAYDYGVVSGSYDKTTNYRWTCPLSGLYSVKGCVYMDNLDGTSAVYGSIRKNGSTVALGTVHYPLANQDVFTIATIDLQLTTGDYLELWLTHNDAAARNALLGDYLTFMTIAQISPPT